MIKILISLVLIKGFPKANILLSLRLVHVKTVVQKILTENLNEII